MPSFNLTIELYKANRIVFGKPFRYACLRAFVLTTGCALMGFFSNFAA